MQKDADGRACGTACGKFQAFLWRVQEKPRRTSDRVTGVRTNVIFRGQR